MKKTIFLSVLFWINFAVFVFAQKKIEGHWGKDGYDVAYAAAATNDGGYIITGLTQSGVDTIGDIIIVKTTGSGDTLWTMVYGGPKLEGGNCIISTSDGGYLVAGHTEDFGAKDCDAFMMKLNRNHSIEWFKVYGGEFDDISEGVLELPEGGFIFAGITASYGNAGIDGNRHIYFVRTNSTGDTIWTKYYAGSGAEYGYSIANMPQNGFIAVGWTTSFGNGEHDGWLLRLNDDGDTLWTRRYQNGGDTKYYKILPTMDKGYMIAGFTTNTKTGHPLGLMVKLDADGKQLWQRTYGTPAGLTLHDVVQLPNGNLILTGTTFENDTLGKAYILTTNSTGDIINESVPGDSNSCSNAIAAQGNNSYLIAGASAQYGDAKQDFYYMEVDNTISNVAIVNTELPRLFPNPVSDISCIILPSNHAYQNVTIDVVDNKGAVIYNRKDVPANDITIRNSSFVCGTYIFRIHCTDGTQFTGKFIIE